MADNIDKDYLDNLDTSKFFKTITDCIVPSQKDQSVELVNTASVAIISALFTRARILDNDQKPKSMNLFLGVVGPPASGKSMVLAPQEESGKDFDDGERDVLFEDAAKLIVQNQVGSTSLIQRRMKLGYNRAGRLMDQLERAGIVGPNLGSKAREVRFKTEAELIEFLSI